MDTKLTLKLDKNTIEEAKIYAKARNLSLSKIIEHYLEFIIQKQELNQYSTIVKELSGIIDLPDNFDLKDDYTDYLQKKYL